MSLLRASDVPSSAGLVALGQRSFGGSPLWPLYSLTQDGIPPQGSQKRTYREVRPAMPSASTKRSKRSSFVAKYRGLHFMAPIVMSTIRCSGKLVRTAITEATSARTKGIRRWPILPGMF